jgi:anti-sigma factor RsiW
MEPHQDSERCKEIFALLSDYLNVELPPEACRHIDRHLAGCPPCVDFVESLRKTIELCRRYRPAELPPALSQHAREELLAAYQKMLAGSRA